LADGRRPFPACSSIGLNQEHLEMTKTIDEPNKALLLEAFDALFNKQNYKAAERLWSPNYLAIRKRRDPR
jgi:hypothetical protein